MEIWWILTQERSAGCLNSICCLLNLIHSQLGKGVSHLLRGIFGRAIQYLDVSRGNWLTDGLVKRGKLFAGQVALKRDIMSSVAGAAIVANATQ